MGRRLKAVDALLTLMLRVTSMPFYFSYIFPQYSARLSGAIDAGRKEADTTQGQPHFMTILRTLSQIIVILLT